MALVLNYFDFQKSSMSYFDRVLWSYFDILSGEVEREVDFQKEPFASLNFFANVGTFTSEMKR